MRGKLLYIQWINRVLLCSSESYIQYPVTIIMENNMKKYIYESESLYYIEEINITL